MKRLLVILTLFIGFKSYSAEIKILTYNIDSSFFSAHKKELLQIRDVINYYDADIHLFQNTFNKKSDLLKQYNVHPYFTYDENIKKRTGNILTSRFPITEEGFKELDAQCSIWKIYGITYARLKINNKIFFNTFNVTLPKKDKYIWENLIKIEKYIKRISYDSYFLLNIEFNKTPTEGMIEYLKNSLNLQDNLMDYTSKNNLDISNYFTGNHHKKNSRTNFLFTGNLENKLENTEILRIFDGGHDENKYLKDSSLLYHLNF